MDLVDLFEDTVKIVLLSTVGEFESFVLSDFDESLQPLLSGEDAWDQAFDCLGVGRFVEIDVERFVYRSEVGFFRSDMLK